MPSVQSIASIASIASMWSHHVKEDLDYPRTRRSEAKETLHGVEVPDPYRWLEDARSPEVQEWMRAQDSLARAYLSKLPGRDALATRLRELFYIDSQGAPRRRGNRRFFMRRGASQEKAIVYWKQGSEGPETVLFDPNAWSADGSVSLGSWEVSWDGGTVAYTVHENNSDAATLHVMNVGTGRKSPA